MKRISTIICLLLLQSCVFITNKESSVKSDTVSQYYLIRHAEKDRSDATNKNPNLTKEGLERAERWAEYFSVSKIDMVFSTDYNRTKQTAMPTAKVNGIEIQFYNPSTLNMEEFLMKTKGKTVLIVGHSNTTPQFANDLLGEDKYEDFADDNNADLIKITITEKQKTSQLLRVE